jgi:exopolyphosphatase/guanosine-5'-triphosphate,3'-diphosphate pyrophosphatase
MRAAVLDVGSNTVRLLVAAKVGRSLKTILVDGVHLGLASDIERDRSISARKLAEARTLAAYYARVAQNHGATRFEVIVTAPGRQSENSDALVAALADGSGASVRVLSPEEEISLAYAGAVRALARQAKSVAVCEVGGGSTQLLARTPSAPRWMRSLDVGSLRLTERYLRSDPPTRSELDRAREDVAARFEKVTPPSVRTVLATGGSARRLKRLVGRNLGEKELSAALELAVSEPSAELAAEHEMKPARARTLAAGAIILAEAQKRFDVPLRVARDGLREGTVLSLLEAA